MLKIPVDRLQEGQVLAQDVTRGDGVILMSQGTTITEDAKGMLVRLEVDSVMVQGDRFGSPEERQACVDEINRALDERFSRVRDDKLLSAIRELLRRCMLDGL
jgi:hypothetical protein